MEHLSLAINLTFVGMSVVFLALIVLAAVISLFKVVFVQKGQSDETSGNMGL